MNFQNFEKDHVQPIFTRNTCDSTRRKCMFVSVAMAISEIFTKKVTRLMDNEFEVGTENLKRVLYKHF